jgi:hypothetical protein
MNARYGGDVDGDDDSPTSETDPRLKVIEGGLA